MALTPRTAAAGTGLAAAAGLIWWAMHRPRDLPGRAELISKPKSTVIGSDGAVRSIQTARLSLPADDLERLWTKANLENLGATYWVFLTRVTLGIVRVRYGDEDRRVTLFGLRRLTLLRFALPEFEADTRRAQISWTILDGLLVAPRGRDSDGGLALEVERAEHSPASETHPGDTPREELTIEVEVFNFYPSLSSWLGEVVYEGTQAVVHVMVTNAFLRSLASLELRQSRIGRFVLGDLSHPGGAA